jgi:hypothetical protein
MSPGFCEERVIVGAACGAYDGRSPGQAKPEWLSSWLRLKRLQLAETVPFKKVYAYAG